MKVTYMILLAAQINEGSYWADVGVKIFESVVAAIFVAMITSWLLNKAFRKSKYLGESIGKAGIQKIDYSSGKMTKKDRNILFGLKGNPMPTELKICFITGDNFCKDNFGELANLVQNGRTIKALIGNPCPCERSKEYFEKFSPDLPIKDLFCSEDDKKKLAQLYTELNELNGDKLRERSYLERTYLMVSKDIIYRKAREKYAPRTYNDLTKEEKQSIWMERISSTGDHVMQAVLVTRMLQAVNRFSDNGGKVELHYYHDEYRIPITLAEYDVDAKNKENKLMLWTNMNAPVRETIKSVNVFGVDISNEKATYVNDVNCTFDYLLEKYPDNEIILRQ